MVFLRRTSLLWHYMYHRTMATARRNCKRSYDCLRVVSPKSHTRKKSRLSSMFLRRDRNREMVLLEKVHAPFRLFKCCFPYLCNGKSKKISRWGFSVFGFLKKHGRVVVAENLGKNSSLMSLNVDEGKGSVYKAFLKCEDSGEAKLRSCKFGVPANDKNWSSFCHLPLVKKASREEILFEAFTPIRKEEKSVVVRAFSSNRRGEVLVSHVSSKINITPEVIGCLKPGKWLNDEVINLYFVLLKERERREPQKFLNCHFFNTFFYQKLIHGGSGYDYNSVKRWTTQKKLGYCLIDCDRIFVPIHNMNHWTLAVINIKDKKLQYLDSFQRVDSQALRVLAQYFHDEVKDKNGVDIDLRSWNLENVENLPVQQNGFDCGVFMIKYADFYSRGFDLCFEQCNMTYFRVRTAKEILKLRAD